MGERGLSRIEATSHPNLMVAYAAAPGEAALDGPAGGNSPYAKALIKHLAEPGLDVSLFFRKVRRDVLEASNGKQQPFETSSLTDDNLVFRNATK